MSRAALIAAAAAAVLLCARAARADNIWERALEGPTQSARPHRPTPPRELDEYGKQMWWGDYHALRLAQKRVDLTGLSRPGMYYLQKAILGYERAIKADPTKAAPHLRLAEVLYGNCLALDRHCGVMRPEDVRATVLHHWEEFERLAPKDPRLQRIWRSRSLEYTKLATDEGLKKALGDYTKLCDTIDLDQLDPDEAGRVTSNRAEVHMMLGQMPEAITWYKRALDFSINADWGFGLAVAYDRDGQGMRAREMMRSYLTKSTLSQFVGALEQGSLFFVPKGEVYYYFALMHEELGNYDLAISAYRRFIDSHAHPQFEPRARDNIAHLRKKMGSGWHPPRGREWSRLWYIKGYGRRR